MSPVNVSRKRLRISFSLSSAVHPVPARGIFIYNYPVFRSASSRGSLVVGRKPGKLVGNHPLGSSNLPLGAPTLFSLHFLFFLFFLCLMFFSLSHFFLFSMLPAYRMIVRPAHLLPIPSAALYYTPFLSMSTTRRFAGCRV